MDHRQLPDDVTRGIGAISTKIRALADARCDRTEISHLLGVRYQQVRKVLVDTGITSGLRRQVEAEREPITVDAGPKLCGATSADVLLRASFSSIGEWTQTSKMVIRLGAKVTAEPGVYAFVVNDVVVYVGLTNNGLKARLDGYRVGHKGQRTNARVKQLIIDTLSKGQPVAVLVALPAPLEWNGLPVNTAAGLEAGLIQMCRPVWNITGAA
jgi:hypothetical protein